MAIVVAFSNQKGGVGKTTTCVNLAAYLALGGYKVLLVDLDMQASATSSLGEFDKNIHNSIYSAMLTQDLATCIVRSEINGLDFVPSSLDLCGFEKDVADVDKKEFLLSGALDTIKDDYDFVFVDCAPSINTLLVNALCAADGVIIPLQCEYLALEGMNQLLNTVYLAKNISTSGLKCTELRSPCIKRAANSQKTWSVRYAGCLATRCLRARSPETCGLQSVQATANPSFCMTTNAQARSRTTRLQKSLYQKFSRSEVWQTQKAALVQKA